jgi:hypothetical protein
MKKHNSEDSTNASSEGKDDFEIVSILAFAMKEIIPFLDVDMNNNRRHE